MPVGAAGSDDGREELWPRRGGWSILQDRGPHQRWSSLRAGLMKAYHRFPNHWGTLPGIVAADGDAGCVPGAGDGCFRGHPTWFVHSAPSLGGPVSPGVRSYSHLSLD